MEVAVLEDRRSNEKVEAIANKLQGWIRTVARRYSEGRYQCEDLIQESLILLVEAVRTWDLHPDSIDFEKFLKRKITHLCIDKVRFVRTKSRDCKRSVGGDAADYLRSSSSDDTDPIEYMIREEMLQLAKESLKDCDKDVQLLFDTVLDPPAELSQLVQEEAMKSSRRLRRSRPRLDFYGQVLGWNYQHTKYTWATLRRRVGEFLESYSAM